MIHGITKPPTPEAPALSADARRTAAALYISSVEGLFDKFDHVTDGSGRLSMWAPHQGSIIESIADRSTHDMVVFAPDCQMHLYGHDSDDEAWRKDFPIIGSEDALTSEPSRLCIDQDEVRALFGMLMRGEISDAGQP